MNRESEWIEVKVGIFVVGALSILIAAALWMTGSPFFRGRTTDYRVLMKSAGEIAVGDRVRMAGVSIGRVSEVRLRPNQEWPVAFQVALSSEVPIKADSTARIVTAGLLGDGVLQIDAGSAEAPLLNRGGEILGEASPDIEEILKKMARISTEAEGGIKRMTAFVDTVSLETRPLLKNMNALLSEENVGHARKILGRLEETLERSGPRMVSLSARLDSISARLDASLQEAPAMMKTFSELGTDFRTALGPKGLRLSNIFDRTEETLASAQRSLSIVDDHREAFSRTMADLQVTASNLRTFSQEIKERPFSLTRIHPAPDRRPGQNLREGSR